MTMDRRKSLGTLLSLLVLPATLSCARQAAPLSVSAHAWPGYELLFLAAREGWIGADEVRLIETGSATESMQRLQHGEVDAACLTLDETLNLLAQGVDLRVALVFDLSSGADALIAKPQVPDLAALAGKRIGVEETAVGALMLQSSLKAARLERNAVQIVPLRFDQHETAWATDAIDAIVTFEPILSKLIDAGGKVLFDSTHMPDTIIDVLAVSTDAFSAPHKRRALEAVIRGHFRALHYLRTHPADAAYRLAARLGISGPDALRSFRGLLLPDEHQNRRMLQPGGRLQEVAASLSALMLEWGYLQQPPRLDRLFDDRSLPRTEDR